MANFDVAFGPPYEQNPPENKHSPVCMFGGIPPLVRKPAGVDHPSLFGTYVTESAFTNRLGQVFMCLYFSELSPNPGPSCRSVRASLERVCMGPEDSEPSCQHWVSSGSRFCGRDVVFQPRISSLCFYLVFIMVSLRLCYRCGVMLGKL